MTLELTLAAFVISQVADVLTTFRFLKHGHPEGNPVVQWLMDTTGRAWPFVKGGVSVAAAAVWNWRAVK